MIIFLRHVEQVSLELTRVWKSVGGVGVRILCFGSAVFRVKVHIFELFFFLSKGLEQAFQV